MNYTTTSVDLNSPARRTIVCDCGEKARWLSPHVYRCGTCEQVIRVSPRIGRVYISDDEFRQLHPGLIERAVPQGLDLQPEDPSEF